MENILSRKTCPLAVVLFAICLMDIISTSVVLQLGGREFNPIMNFVLKHGGIGLMTLVKLLTIICAVVPLEWAKAKSIISQKRHRNYYLTTIFLYAGVYGFFFMVANFGIPLRLS